ncbi:MAG: AzlC family ABC transporter permease [Clostridia bacterium]|nr:AzlC family ABC transporter permease [Clostridia bacterium]
MKSYLYGIKRSVPVFFGFLPVAVTFAIMAGSAGLGKMETVLMSVFVFAGASQIMAVGQIMAGSGAVSIIIATFVLNLRHVIMSTCIFKRVRVKNILLRFACALSVTDEGFALITTEDEEKCDIPFLLGIITLTYLSWIFGTVVGVVASSILPQIVADSFGIALYALFLALIVPDIKGSLRLLATVLITAALNCALCMLIESSQAIIISTLVGALIGAFIVEDKAEEGVLA